MKTILMLLFRWLSKVPMVGPLLVRFRFHMRLTKRLMTNKRKYRRFQIGQFTYGQPTIVSPRSSANLIIGKYCAIAGGVSFILGGEHRTDWITTYPFNELFSDAQDYTGHPFAKGDIVIGNDVWIGLGATIMSGVSVGDGAVIGARAVVTKDVPPYGVAAGNPARIVKYRFDPNTIECLQRIAWWDWPFEKVQEAWPLLLSPNIQEFIGRYEASSALDPSHDAHPTN